MQRKEDFYKQVPLYEHVCSGLFALRQEYPRQLKVFSIGKSVLGRQIYVATLGEVTGATLFVGGIHGQEWLTSLLMLRFLEDLLFSIAQNTRLADIDVKKSMQKRGLAIIPTLNPDGIEIALRGAEGACYMKEHVQALCGGQTGRWQANARGVDLNHNFDAGWETRHKLEREAGILGPSPTRYGGKSACSEPETKALCGFCQAFLPRQLYAFHAQGEEIYYRYGEHTPSRSRLMAQLLATSSAYRLVMQEGLAAHGGCKDWFIENFHRPGFTIEIGKGKNPLPLSELQPIYERVQEMLMLALLL